MKRSFTFLLFAVLVVLAASAAYADTLHGYCVPPAAACTDNGTITPTGDNPPYFAFSYAGNLNNAHGDFWLIGLVADNQNNGFSLNLNGTNTTNPSASASLVIGTEWNSGFLSAYLLAQGGPFTFPHNSHPLDAYLPSTQAVDPGANGYFVYLFDFGAFDYKTAAGDPSFSVGSGDVPIGTVFLAVLVDPNHSVSVDTPNSASIIETAPPPGVPEPGTLVLLGSGVVGMAGMLRRMAQR